MFSPLIEQLIRSLQCLPGVGPKSAQRLAFHLLEKRTRGAADQLVNTLKQALQSIQRCGQCQTLSETPLCTLCANPKRDPTLLCVVETPMDIIAIEHTQSYRGYYFVLMGHLSPLEGIGPNELGIPLFLECLKIRPPSEVILATGSTVEGETTAHYLWEVLREKGILVSRLAHGIPLGNELEFVGSHTLMHALSDRKTLHYDN